MKKLHAFCCSWLLVCGSLAAQKPLFAPADLAQIVEAEAKGHAGKFSAPADRAPTDDYDMKYHRLEWAIDPAQKHIQGRATYYFVPKTTLLPTLHLDLTDSLTVDVARWHGIPISFAHTGNVLAIQMHHPLPMGALDSVTVSYHGVPPATGFGSFVQDEHAGAPIVWTLSEPYGARDWWPCKQDLGDKIDSLDVLVTCPTGDRAAGNGLLVSETNDPATGQTTFHWRHRYPIASYLVGVAVTNYAQYTDQAELASGPLPILNYVFPENLAAAQAESPGIVPLIEFFDSLFVPYPFRKEKYGHAQFGWGGGIEHQTMSFMANFGYELMAHELAHQWFGNHVTCGSWADIWLNEGFATYLSGLCYERFSPNLYWPIFKQQRIQSITAQPGGSVWVDDTTSVSRIFNGRLSYAKGAMALNQLRWVVGDAAFFSGARNYLNDSRLSGNFARTADLRAQLETSSGQSLGWYFDDWIFGQGHPSYHLVWEQMGSTVSVKIEQAQSHPAVGFFEMPVPVRLKSAGGQTLDARLSLSSNGQVFQIENVPFAVSELLLDPDLWLISKDNTVAHGSVGTAEIGLAPARIFPNPSSGRATVAAAEGQKLHSVRVFDGLGRMVQNFENQEVAALEINLAGLAAGAYFVEIATKDAALQRALLLKTW